ncbi:MAG TPA: transcription elongation factor GreA [Petrotogaceae bacterium]|jgi:transcription elongation factor GreA|nr:transcription elongation factor GreA [Petrotogaceae bacterium]HQF34000.1 transcription elongation factor GreA [Petrotogaceae bacterium]
MSDTVVKLTKEGYEKLKKERDDLKEKLMGEIANRIKEARELGDLSENSEYEEAKNEQGKIDSRIKEIEYILDHAEIIEEEEDSSVVGIGKRIKIRDMALEKEKQEKIITLVTSQEASIREDKISEESPIGKAIKGKKVGETITVKTNSGSKKIKIVEIISEDTGKR